MDLATRLPASSLAHLRFAVGREHTIIPARGWPELAEIVRKRPVDVAVVDPRAEGAVETEAVRTLMARYQSLPVVVYTALAPDSLRATLELARYGARQVVLRGFDDEPRRLMEMLERQPAHALGDLVMQRLSDQLALLPVPLVRAIGRVFTSPHAYLSAGDVARSAGMARRTLDRWLDKAGLAPARVLLVAARLARASHFLADPGYLMEDIAAKLGYPTPRLFSRQVRSATGLTTTEFRRQLDPERFTEQLAVMLCRHGGGSPNDESSRTHIGRGR